MQKWKYKNTFHFREKDFKLHPYLKRLIGWKIFFKSIIFLFFIAPHMIIAFLVLVLYIDFCSFANCNGRCYFMPLAKKAIEKRKLSLSPLKARNSTNY